MNSGQALRQSSGQAALIAVFVLMMATLSSVFGAVSIGVFASGEAEHMRQSHEAFFVAESGIDDAVYRFKSGKNVSSSFQLVLGESVATIIVSDISGGKQIVSHGNSFNAFRSARSHVLLGAEGVDFFYGVQVGEGGMLIENNARIEGNIFSNGSIVSESGAVITGTVTVANSGNRIERMNIGEDAYVDQCVNSDIDGVLNTNSNSGCSFGTFQALGNPPTPVPLPISQGQIEAWKSAAEASGTIGNVNLGGDDTLSLGPKKIVGDLVVQNSAVLTITGALWVTGKVELKNSAQVHLDSSYGAASGFIIADGIIEIQNNSISSGSGSEESYLMYLSTATGDSALIVKNNAVVDIVYTPSGGIVVENLVELKEITGYRVHIKNNTVLTYEFGLANSNFSSGPSGGWLIQDWGEIVP